MDNTILAIIDKVGRAALCLLNKFPGSNAISTVIIDRQGEQYRISIERLTLKKRLKPLSKDTRPNSSILAEKQTVNLN